MSQCHLIILKSGHGHFRGPCHDLCAGHGGTPGTEIREFREDTIYRVIGTFLSQDMKFDAEWRSVDGSCYFQSPKLYKENGLRSGRMREALIARLKETDPLVGALSKVERKKETKNPPLLYNLAELQNDCSKMFKISPDETLKVVQELYEKNW